MIAAIGSLIKLRKSPRREQVRRRVVATKVGETGTSIPSETSPPHLKIRGRARRMWHQWRSYASYATNLIGSSNALSGANLQLLCKRKRGKRRKERQLPQSYSMSF